MVRAKGGSDVSAELRREPVRVLLADRHLLVRTGLRHVLRDISHVQIVGEASSTDEVLKLVPECNPQVIVADLHLPAFGVMDLLRRLARGRRPAVLVTSEVVDGSMACRVLDAGALAFLSHNSHPTTIAAAVDAATVGKPYLGSDVIAEVAYRRVNASKDPMASLSTREFEILRLITEGRSVAEVADVLSLSPRSVANYQTHIKRKLGVATTAGLVHLALRHHIIQVSTDS